MPTGTVTWFNKSAGYGLIQQDDADSSIFVSMATVRAAGRDDLDAGARVKYGLMNLKGKFIAEDLVVNCVNGPIEG